MLCAAESNATRLLRAQAAVRRGLLRQSRGSLPEALEGFLGTFRDFADVPSEEATACVLAASLLALAGRHGEAIRLMDDSAARDPSYAGATADTRHSILFLAGRGNELVRVLEEYASRRHERTREAIREVLLLAILLELSGDAERSRHHVERLVRTYAPGPWWRLALPASFLLGKASREDVRRHTVDFALLGPTITSSSLFYLLGLVMRGRRERATARQLFLYAVETDPFNHWPAVLARKELGRLTPGMKRFLGGK
jgi:tetratricopeptide (TPR) repeat protein